MGWTGASSARMPVRWFTMLRAADGGSSASWAGAPHAPRRRGLRVPPGPVRSILWGLLAALALQGRLYGRDWLEERTPEPRADPVLLQSFGPQFDLEPRGSFRLPELELITGDAQPFGSYLHVTYPAGSASPAASRTDGAPRGGVQFYLRSRAELGGQAHLRYFLRLPEGFDFVRGGKLPGLYGGAANAGGARSGGAEAEGVSARFGWSEMGAGEVYLYSSASGGEAASLGRGAWSWPTGRWVCVEQQVDLGAAGADSGEINVRVDDQLVWQQGGLALRDGGLQLDGVYFSTFFGGKDTSWATPREQSADLAGLRIADSRIGCAPR